MGKKGQEGKEEGIAIRGMKGRADDQIAQKIQKLINAGIIRTR
jgi:hypothetical protein